ncbi:MAG: HNH endonuclease family protein, partial [Arcobacteraceae bacterium]
IGTIENDSKIEYSLKWEDIENYFDGDLDRYLSIVRLILVKEKAKLNLYSEYKNYFEKNSNIKGTVFIDKLDKYKEIYEKVIKLNENKISNKTKNLLTIMHYLPHNDWISAVMSYYYKFGNVKFDEFIEAFDYMVSTDNIIGYDITTKIKDISLILSEIDKSKSPDELLSNEESVLYDIDIEELEHAIKQNIYRKRVSKYILLKIEYISRSNDDVQIGSFQKLTIEHIYPQKPKDIKDWDFNNEIELDKYRNKIGNLVLLNRSKNSSLSNSSFVNKNNKYNSNQSIDIFEETKKVYSPNRSEWKLEDIKTRQNTLIKWLVNNKKVEDWV